MRWRAFPGGSEQPDTGLSSLPSAKWGSLADAVPGRVPPGEGARLTPSLAGSVEGRTQGPEMRDTGEKGHVLLWDGGCTS